TSRGEGPYPSSPARAVVATARARSLHARQLARAALLRLHLAGAGALQRLLQAQSRDVQATLDGADRRLELAGHLLQAPAADVERHQRGAVNRLQTVQALVQLRRTLGADHLLQRRGDRRLGVVQRL